MKTGINATETAPATSISNKKSGIRNAAQYGSSCSVVKRAVSSLFRISPNIREAATMLAITNAADKMLV